jgi:hypothetical protein
MSVSVSGAQLLNGIGEVIGFQHAGLYPNYRGPIRSFWAYRNDKSPVVTWKTAKPLAKKPQAIVFGGGMSELAGKADLLVNAKKILTFDLGVDFVGRKWEAGGYRLQFRQRSVADGSSGIFVLTVPEADVTVGEPVQLTVSVSDGAPLTWFMLYSYSDTIEFEKLTPEALEKLP